MVDKKRLHLMIGLARFREKHEDDALRINRIYQSDFIGFAVLRNFILTTIAYVLLLAVFALYHMDFLLSNLNDLKVRPLLAAVIVIYLIILGIYSVIAYTVARIKYVRMEQQIDSYEHYLGRLQKMYRDEARWRKLTRRWGREDS